MLTGTRPVFKVAILALCCSFGILATQPLVGAENAVIGDSIAPEQLVEIAQKVKADLQLTTDKQVAAAKQKLNADLRRLGAYLKTGGQHGEGWRRFLKWSDLRQQLDADQADLVVLEQVAARFRSEEPGLELPKFLAARRSLRQYIDTAAVRANPDAKASIEGQLDALATELAAFANDPSGERSRLLGQRLGYLYRVGQAKSLIKAVRSQYCQPNLHVVVTRKMLAAGFERKVDDTTDVHEIILGTDIRGVARTTGNVSLKMVASPNRALIQTVMVGQSRSDNVGYNGPVQLFTSGLTQLRATKPIEITAQGLVSRPSHSRANVNTTTNDIRSLRCGIGSGLIERIAWRQAGKKQSQAEGIAARRAEARLNRRVDQEANKLIGETNDKYLSNIRNPLLRLDEFPQKLDLNTTQDALRLSLLQANIHQLGALNKPPELTAGHLLAVRLHQSLVNNFGNAVMAGRTLTEEALQTKLKDLLGEVPEELRSKPDEDPWSITFAESDPITINFAAGGYDLTIRGQRYTSGERAFKAMNISVKYKLERSGGGIKAVRQGKVEIAPPGFVSGKTRLSASQIALRTLLEKRFSKVFKAEEVTDGLVLQGNWAKLGKLSLMQLGCDEGWLTLAWRK